jgi:glycosyltransferase involved in cell wall biosynthesis
MTTDVRATPRVVACMPAWNSTSFIAPVLESIVTQTYRNLELLISVDASTDGTAKLCEEFAASHPNCRVIRQPRRVGWIANTNALLRAADGDYLFFAFHDDPLRPTYIVRLVEALERNPRAVLAFSDMDTNRGPSSYTDLDGVSDRFERARRLLLACGDWWVPNRGLFRATAAKAIGGMRRHLAGENTADWPWLLRLALMGEFVRVPEALVCKNFREESLSSTWKKGIWKRVAVQMACLRVVREAGFPLSQELHLWSDRVALGLKEEWWRLEKRRRRRARG